MAHGSPAKLRRRGCGSRGPSKYPRKPSLPVWCRTATVLIVHARFASSPQQATCSFALVETTTIQTDMLIGTSKVLRHVTIAFSRLQIMIPGEDAMRSLRLSQDAQLQRANSS